jgi:uncharacterized protein (UPF0332 family)
MNLQVYLQNGWIKPHETSREEIAKLLAIAERDLRQSKTVDLEPEWRFDIAYNAALQLAAAALAASGYQAERQNKHQRTIECMQFVLLNAQKVEFLNKCHRKRNTSVYEEIGMISDGEAREMIEFAESLRTLVRDWLQKSHPQLFP